MNFFYKNKEQNKNEIILLQKANNLVDYTIKDLSNFLNLKPPYNLKKYKGWVGSLIEYYLGAKSGNKAQQDFKEIGIELKTIPLDDNNVPLESTFVCMAPLIKNSGITWENSYLKNKISRILWIPIKGNRNINLSYKKIGKPLLWSPNKQEEKKIKLDWEELMELIVLGKIENINSCYGECLQLKPKASNSKVLTAAIGKFGQQIFTKPRGFYLKKKFTKKIFFK